MPSRLNVVISQGQSAHPEKRGLEEELVAGLLGVPGVDTAVIPHLYDLTPESSGMLCLQGIAGDLVICSWLYPRAARWTLHRNKVLGQEGTTLLKALGEDEDDAESEDGDAARADDRERVIDAQDIPNRAIYCLDLRAHSSATPYLEEIQRIVSEQQTDVVDLMSWIGGSPEPRQLDRYLSPDAAAAPSSPTPAPPATVNGEPPPRRWYPVIDFSRCTNCMECIDFCLFGVYGVDAQETILVEQPDNCRKGCPACSRVCPENAILFPQHKTPAIAGSPEAAGSLKIDLSKLFGGGAAGPEGEQAALQTAVSERDEQLMLAGRDAVGMSVGIPKRQANKPQAPKDDLDALIDELDDLEL